MYILFCLNNISIHKFFFQVLAFYSREACLKQIEELGPSLGTTLLIILFSFVALYLALGICTKIFLMGATGIEVIPNLSFWSDLPNLVRVSYYIILIYFVIKILLLFA